MSTTVWMAIGVAVVVVFWAAAVHNRLRQLRNRVDNAFAQIVEFRHLMLVQFLKLENHLVHFQTLKLVHQTKQHLDYYL